MKRKVIGYVIALMVIISSYNLVLPPNELNVTALVQVEGNALNHSYIRSVAENLSNIVNQTDKGRWFGTEGEWAAKRNISMWMNESGLWTKEEPLLNQKSTYFDQHGFHFNFTSDLVIKDSTLHYQYKNENPVEVKDFYLTPRWHKNSICSLNDNFSDWSDMTRSYTITNISILPRPYFLSDCLNGFVQGTLFQILSFIVNNQENISKILSWLLDFFLENYNLTIQELEVHPEKASQIEGFSEDTQAGRCGNYSFIWEDQHFNPDKDERYWQGWNEIFDVVLAFCKDNITATRWLSMLKSSKVLMEAWIVR